MLYSALAGGGREALSLLGSGVQAGAKFVGANDLADRAAEFAHGQQAFAAQNENPAWEGTSPWSPSGLAYRVLKGLPTAVPLAAAAVAAPEVLGGGALTGALTAGALGFLPAVGGNVQTSEALRGPLSQGEAGRALAYGVPEAAIGAWPMGRLEGMFAKGAEGGVARAVTGQAGVQAIAGAGQDYVAQQMGDPDRPIAQRAQEMVEAALTGGATGALFGAGVHALAKVRPAQVSNADLKGAIDQEVKPQTAQQPQIAGLLEPPAIPMGGPTEPRPYAQMPIEDVLTKARSAIQNGDQETALAMTRELRYRNMLNEAGQPLLAGPPLDAEGRPVTQTLQEPEEPAHEPTLATVPKRDIEGTPLFDKKGNPLSTRAPIELGHTAQGEPVTEPPVAGLLNAPPPEPTPTGEMGQNRPYSGEVLKMPDRSAPAPETVRQMTEEAAQDAGVKRVPKTFSQATTLEDMQTAIRAKWEEGGPNKLVRKLAAKFDMLDENGDLKPQETPQGVTGPDLGTGKLDGGAADASGPVRDSLGVQSAVNPIRDAVPEQHQERFDKLEALRAAVPADQQPTIDKAQEALTSPGKGVKQNAEATIRMLNDVAEGHKAATKLAEQAGEPQPAPAVNPAEKTVTTAPIEEPAPSAAANALIERLQKVPGNPSEKPGTRPGDTGVMKGTYSVPASADETIERMNAVAGNPSGKAASDKFQPIRDAATAVQKSLRSLDKVNPVPEGAEPKAATALKNLWSRMVGVQQDRLNTVTTALKSDPESLRTLSDNHFYPSADRDPARAVTTAIYDAASRFSPEAQQALDAHAELEAKVLDARDHALPVGDMFARPAAPGDIAPRNQQDVDVTGIVRTGGKAQDVLGHLTTNGGTAQNRVLAMDFANRKPDVSVKFDKQGDTRFHNLAPGEQAAAAYDPKTKTIRLFQGANLEQSVLHETVHALSHIALDAGGPAATEFKALHNEVLTRLQGGAADTVTQEQAPHVLAAIENPYELLAEGMTNLHFQDWLRSQPAIEGKTSLWQKFKAGVAKLLGYEGGKKTLLDQLLERGNRVMDEQANMKAIAGEAASAKAWGYHGAHNTPEDVEQHARPAIEQTKETLDGAMQRLQDLADGRPTAVRTGVLKTVLGWVTSDHIAEQWGKLSQGITDHVGVTKRVSVYKDLNDMAANAAAHAVERLPAATRKTFDELTTAAQMGINPMKPWGDNAHLFDDPRVGEFQALHQKAFRAWGKLEPEERAAFQGLISNNRSGMKQLFAASLHTLLSKDFAKEAPQLTAMDPSAAYQGRVELHGQPAGTEAFWSDAYDKLSTIGGNFVKAADGDVAKLKVALTEARKEQVSGLQAAKTKKDVREAQNDAREKVKGLQDKITDAQSRVSALRDLMGAHDKMFTDLDQVPNFHMGRNEGDFFVAGKLAVGEDGKVPAENVARLQAALQKAGYGDKVVSRLLDNPEVYLRAESVGDMGHLREAFSALEQAKVMEEGSTSNGAIGSRSIPGVTPQWQERILSIASEALGDLPKDANPETQAAAQQYVANMRRGLLDALPGSSVKKVMAKRAGVQGFDEDTLAGFRSRAAATSGMNARLATMTDGAAASARMRSDVEAMNRSSAPDATKLALSAVVNELAMRSAQQPIAQPRNFISNVRLFTHIMEVGTSPAYTLMLMSQLGTLSLPRLGAAAGYLKSARAMSASTRDAIRTIGAVMDGPATMTFGCDLGHLIGRGMSEENARFIMNMQARGALAHAAHTTAMRGEFDLTTPLGRAKAWGSAMGLYSEMVPRVLTALAAKRLYDGLPEGARARESMEDFAHRMVDRSQMSWDPSLNPRQMTRAGSFGPASPLINQFMGYQTRLTELMYRETERSFSANQPDHVKAEARKFLLGHLAAITTLSGTLGLPMAAVAASVYDRLADWVTNTDDHDVTASYRNYLASTFGKGLGEVIARGVPRMAGVDLSHMGDERMMPGSTTMLALTEKRKFEDAEKDWLKAEAGSAAGLGANFILGGRDIVNGDYLRGLQKMLPDALRGPDEAAQLALRGYVDKNGTKLPGLTASAQDILMTAIGLDPGDEAQYREKQKTLSGITNLSEVRQQNITQHLSQAMNRGDTDNFQYWVSQSQQYQQDHPGMRPPIADLQRLMMQHARSAAYGAAVGAPLGLSPRNIAGRGMVTGW